ncbi:recombinase family protein [Spirosoma sordidisoli]|uniref:Recombinase family protein n=1 Tax=Spirosoma sordidisoli TaxID=2502893 RepID=A0A4Q2UBX1_9BACT|nr:recombinase family protein [Spirosoma sordidisoli]
MSTKRQGDSGLGLDAQRAYIEHYYSDKPILAEFTDVQSGKDVFNRPELMKALALCQEQQAILVVAKIDRLSRNTEQALAIYRELAGRLESCDIPNLDKFTLTLFMAIADRERELISIRTTGALVQKVKRSGQWRKGSQAFTTGRAARLGHATIKAQAAQNGQSRPASAMINQLRQQHYSWSAIARHLNAGGFKTPKGGHYQAVQVQRLYQRALAEAL